MTNQELSVPAIKVEGTAYEVRWDEGVVVRFERLYTHRDYQVDAEIVVTDNAELAPHLLGPVRTSITRTWRNVITELERVSDRADWRQRLTQATILVLERHRRGAPVVALGSMDSPSPPVEQIPGLTWFGVPILIYGEGGIGKSSLCLALASAIHTGRSIGGMAARQSNVLYLDWEASDTLAYWRTKQILDGQGIDGGEWPDPERPDSGRTGMVFYRYMSGSLVDSAVFLKGEIARLNVGTVCIDSAGPATGGEPESAEATLRMFEALRGMGDPDRPLTSLILAHVSHEGRRAGRGQKSPFGSVFWLNLPRSCYELEASRSGNTAEFAVHHRKSNLGPLLAPRGIRMTWTHEGGVEVEGFDIKSNAELVEGLPLAERVGMVLRTEGGMSTADISERLHTPPRTVSTTLSRHDGFRSKNGLWETTEPLGTGDDD